MTFSEFLMAVSVFLVGALIGNHEGDQATIRDCATKGRAVMAGGGAIRCEVEKEKT